MQISWSKAQSQLELSSAPACSVFLFLSFCFQFYIKFFRLLLGHIGDILAGSFAVRVSEPAKMSPSQPIRNLEDKWAVTLTLAASDPREFPIAGIQMVLDILCFRYFFFNNWYDSNGHSKLHLFIHLYPFRARKCFNLEDFNVKVYWSAWGLVPGKADH